MRIGAARSTPRACAFTRSSLPAARLLRREDRPATRRCAAATRVHFFPPLVLGPVALVRVVVRQLFPGRDVADGLDVDPAPVVDRLAVRSAAVVDEPCLVPTDRGVDHLLVTDAKEKRVMAAHGAIVVPAIRPVVRDDLARVLDDSCPPTDRPDRERPTALDRR